MPNDRISHSEAMERVAADAEKLHDLTEHIQQIDDPKEKIPILKEMTGVLQDYQSMTDSCIELLPRALEAIYGEKTADVIDYARGQEQEGKDFFDVLAERVAADFGSEEKVDTGTETGEESQQPRESSGIEMDRQIHDALSEIYDGDEDKVQDTYQYLYEHYDGDKDKIGDTVNFAFRLDADTYGMTKDEALGEKVIYDDTRAVYDESRGKYLFRNTFTLMDKLEMNLAAYRTGLPGADGKVVSGGTIAMNIIELSRSNIIASLVEMGVRALFDKLYPPKADAVDKGTEVKQNDGAAVQSAAAVEEDRAVRDVTGILRDDGYAEHGFDKTAVEVDKENPAAGIYFGADTSRAPNEYMGIRSWATDVQLKDTQVINGETVVMRINPMRVTELQGNTYLVDFSGKAFPIEISNEKTALNLDIGGMGYIREMDYTATERGKSLISGLAESKGISVEACRTELADITKTAYIEKTAAMQEKHEAYIENTLLPEIKGDIEAYRENIAVLEAHNADGEDTAAIQGLIDKYSSAIEQMEARAAALEATVERYQEARIVVNSDKTDLDAKLTSLLSAEKDAAGRTGYVSYGLEDVDKREMAAALQDALARDEIDSVEAQRTETAAEESHVEVHAEHEEKPVITVSETREEAVEKERAAYLERSEEKASALEAKIAGLEELRDQKNSDIREAKELLQDFESQGHTDTERIEGLKEAISDREEEIKQIDTEKEEAQSELESITKAQDAYVQIDMNTEYDPEQKLEATKEIGEELGLSSEEMTEAHIEAGYPEEHTDDTDAAEDVRDNGVEPATNAGMEAQGSQEPANIEEHVDVEEANTEAVATPQTTDKEKDTDDAAIVADAEASKGKHDVEEAIEKYLDQGADGTFSFQDDFLKEQEGTFTQDELYDAVKNKIAEIETEVKAGEGNETDIARICDVLDAVMDYSIDHFIDQIEKMTGLIDALANGDVETAGNAVIEAYLDRMESELEPLSSMSDMINEYLDPEGAANGELLKESVLSDLESIGMDLNDANVERIVDIAQSINSIFDGFENLIFGMAETYGGAVDLGVETPVADVSTDFAEATVDTATDICAEPIAAEDIMQMQALNEMNADTFEPDFDIAQLSPTENFEAFADIMRGTETAVDSGIEAATDETIEAIAAML